MAKDVNDIGIGWEITPNKAVVFVLKYKDKKHNQIYWFITYCQIKGTYHISRHDTNTVLSEVGYADSLKDAIEHILGEMKPEIRLNHGSRN